IGARFLVVGGGRVTCLNPPQVVILTVAQCCLTTSFSLLIPTLPALGIGAARPLTALTVFFCGCGAVFNIGLTPFHLGVALCLPSLVRCMAASAPLTPRRHSRESLPAPCAHSAARHHQHVLR